MIYQVIIGNHILVIIILVQVVVEIILWVDLVVNDGRQDHREGVFGLIVVLVEGATTGNEAFIVILSALRVTAAGAVKEGHLREECLSRQQVISNIWICHFKHQLWS